MNGTARAVGSLAMRPLATDDDYWRLRELLRRIMILEDRGERCWHVARLDSWWWFANPDLEHLPPERHIFLWESAGGELVAAVNPEGHGQAFLQVDPAVRSAGLDEAMPDVAEAHLGGAGPDGRTRLQVFVDSQDRSGGMDGRTS